jgi:hypothetical protein
MKDETKKVDAAVVLASLMAEARPIIKKLTSVAIVDNDSFNLKAERIAALKELETRRAAREASLTDPLYKVIDDIRELFSPLKQIIEAAEKQAKAELIEYDDLVDRLKEKINNDFESGKIAKLSTVTSKLANLENHHTNASIKRLYKLECMNTKLTPPEYLIPDTKAIEAALKAGEKVKGWKLTVVKSAAVRQPKTK